MLVEANTGKAFCLPVFSSKANVAVGCSGAAVAAAAGAAAVAVAVVVAVASSDEHAIFRERDPKSMKIVAIISLTDLLFCDIDAVNI